MTIIEPGPVTQHVLNALAELSEAVCGELAASGAGPTCWCGLYPGAAVSWEYCGECSGDHCGMGYVRLASVFPYSTFPVQVIDFQCTLPLAWSVEVGALRCLHQPTDGELLGPEAMSFVAIEQVLDAQALYRALKCYGYQIAAEGYVPVGPQGGCVGGFWRAHLALD
jgi:hypothetical protein